MKSNEKFFFPRMKPNTPNKLNITRTILISTAFLSVLIALTYNNFKVPLLLYDMIEDNFLLFGLVGEITLVGIIMTMNNITAVILQPYFGALSDRTASKFGRRMPYIIIGIIACSFFFAITP